MLTSAAQSLTVAFHDRDVDLFEGDESLAGWMRRAIPTGDAPTIGSTVRPARDASRAPPGSGRSGIAETRTRLAAPFVTGAEARRLVATVAATLFGYEDFVRRYDDLRPPDSGRSLSGVQEATPGRRDGTWRG
jgi:hypothetical protein